ncbi:MAG: hypothetical protein ATN31_03325 [Candidatus Epulonipiscioides saccharophilum]|nr:MAG: hypothetical protein ATN31_03325 [Epulopiscium sp. AS2M-Bin001]
MDTIIFAISKHNAFVCDYYKGEFKNFAFSSSDFYELYCHHDLSDLIDYLNYPLNCKKFKDSNVIIMYDEPIIYEYFYKNKLRFELASQVTLLHLNSVIWAYIASRNKTDVYSFEGTFFQLTNNGLEEINEDDLDECLKIIPISLIDLSKMLVDNNIDTLLLDDQAARDILRLQLNTHINTEFKDCLVLSPATIRNIKKSAQNFLEVNDILVPESLVKDQSYVQAGSALFSYIHEVTKLRGKKESSLITKKAYMDGTFSWHPDIIHTNNEVWAKKDAIVGVIS